MKIEVYSDGSATTMDKPGGWGYCVVVDGLEIHRQGGSLVKATNNVAEIQAAIEGLSYVKSYILGLGLSPEIQLVSDSQLVLKYATGEYQCKAMHLTPYYVALRKVFNELKATTRWIKGHSGDHYNEICDKLANEARKAQHAGKEA